MTLLADEELNILRQVARDRIAHGREGEPYFGPVVIERLLDHIAALQSKRFGVDRADPTYRPDPKPLADSTRAALLRAAPRSISIRVLMNHITWLEERLWGIGQALSNETSSPERIRHFLEEHPVLLAYAEEHAAEVRRRVREAERAPAPVVVRDEGEWRIRGETP